LAVVRHFSPHRRTVPSRQQADRHHLSGSKVTGKFRESAVNPIGRIPRREYRVWLPTPSGQDVDGVTRLDFAPPGRRAAFARELSGRKGRVLAITPGR